MHPSVTSAKTKTEKKLLLQTLQKSQLRWWLSREQNSNRVILDILTLNHWQSRWFNTVVENQKKSLIFAKIMSYSSIEDNFSVKIVILLNSVFFKHLTQEDDVFFSRFCKNGGKIRVKRFRNIFFCEKVKTECCFVFAPKKFTTTCWWSSLLRYLSREENGMGGGRILWRFDWFLLQYFEKSLVQTNVMTILIRCLV